MSSFSNSTRGAEHRWHALSDSALAEANFFRRVARCSTVSLIEAVRLASRTAFVSLARGRSNGCFDCDASTGAAAELLLVKGNVRLLFAVDRTARRSDFVYSRRIPQYRSYEAAHFASALPLLRRPVHVDLYVVNIVCTDGFHRRPPLHFRFGIPTSTPPQQCCKCILHAMGRN